MSIPTTLPGCLSLEEHDPVMFDLIEKEKFRQWSGIELIASENFTSKAVMTCLGSALTDKYSEPLALPQVYKIHNVHSRYLLFSSDPRPFSASHFVEMRYALASVVEVGLAAADALF